MITNPDGHKPKEKPYFHQISMDCLEKLFDCIGRFNKDEIDADTSCQIEKQILTDEIQDPEFLEFAIENQKLVGVISDRDLIDREERNTITLDKKAHEIMSRNLITVDVETSIEKASNILLENNISCLPVVSSQGVVEGILTWKDILKFY
ncbi:MAG: CBS domain-containing protein, partial [Candidatus Scalindua sp.]